MYKFVARSDTDPNGDNGGLGFDDVESAESHAEAMNELREFYNEPNSIWNKAFWKEYPGEWRIHVA